MLADQQIKKIIIKNQVLSEKEFDESLKEAKNNNKSIYDYLIEKNIISPFTFYENVANYYGVPFIDLKNKNIRKDVLFTIPEPIASTHNILAFETTDKEIELACLDPENMEIFEFIEKKTGLKPKISVTTPESLKDCLKNYHKSLKAEFEYLDEDKAKEADQEDSDLKKMAEDLPVVRIVDTLLEYAVMENASDIHIEPEEKNLLVRYRIDGILHNVMVLPKTVQSGIAARIKILANLKVDEHRLPQDGRFKIAGGKNKVSFRVSIIPTYDGEKIVMRLLNETAQILTLEQLGLHEKQLKTIKRNIAKPHGIILVTGPTGSGKTTTLYTVLNILNKPEVNICTIEDPIEYRMPHINQSQTNNKIGFTFAGGLRAFLRQDPDIIMVGEIRDKETGEIAVHAAMTGHLVLSTIHTNDAATTMPRLSEMGIPLFLIASTMNLIIAQRLVRKICPHCIQSYNLSKETMKELEAIFEIKNLMSVLAREKAVLPSKKDLTSLLFYRGKGCKKCNQAGYKGRIGIYETLENTENIASLILKKAGANEIQKESVSKQMLTMLEDGFIKAINGITTIEEIMRVTKE